MATLFKWLKDCFTNFVFGQPETLIDVIQDQKNALSPEVRRDLIKSIVDNQPERFIQDLNAEQNHVPLSLKEELMANLIPTTTEPIKMPEVVHTGQLIPLDQFKPKILKVRQITLPTPPAKNWKHVFDGVLQQLLLKRFIELSRQRLHEHLQCQSNQDQVIHTGRLIPSDQFKTIHINRYLNKKKSRNVVQRDWTRSFDRVMHQLLFKHFIQIQRYDLFEHARCLNNGDHAHQIVHTGKIIPSGQFTYKRWNRCFKMPPTVKPSLRDWTRSFDRVMEQLKFKRFIQIRLIEQMEHQLCQMYPANRADQCGTLIPSDQFKYRSRPIHHTPKTDYPQMYVLDWCRSIERELEHYNLKTFIQMKRNELKYLTERFPMIPSDQLIPISTTIHPKPIELSKPDVNWKRRFDHTVEQLNLKHFIQIEREKLQSRSPSPSPSPSSSPFLIPSSNELMEDL